MNAFIKQILLALVAIHAVAASHKVVIYWGQDSVGHEQDLRDYCASPSVDIVVVGFVYDFPTSSGSQYPGINFANHCYKTFDSADPNFLDCSDSIAPDITYCQSLGKQILLSFGGADGTYGFSSDSQAQTFATTVWNMFLGGTGSLRPFGNAIFDGIDLDIESGQTRGYAAFITQLRSYFTAQTARTYYISGAPQCVYPDAMMGPGTGTALSDAWFDYVWVQFYNNYCGVDHYPSQFNFNVWANWASSSKNPNVKVFIGAPGSASAAGEGYVPSATLKTISDAVIATFPTNYGGIMLWDAGTALNNGDFATQLAAFLHVGGSTSIISAPPTPTPTPTPNPTPAGTSTSTSSKGMPSSTSTSSKGTSSPTSTSSTSTSAKGRSTSSSRGSSSSSTSTSSSSKGSSSTSSTGAKGTSTSASAPATPTSSSSETCVNGYMKCLPDGSYSTCDHGVWGVSQPCGAKTSCSQSGNYIYCLLSSTPSSTSDSSTNACTAGTQQCVGASAYQTCSNGLQGSVWSATQKCADGLSCHSSATANNIYCY